MVKYNGVGASSGGCMAPADRLDPKVGGRLALALRSSDEPGELLQ